MPQTRMTARSTYPHTIAGQHSPERRQQPAPDDVGASREAADTFGGVTPLHGDLSVEARARYAYVEALLRADLHPPASVVELGSAPGDQIARLAKLGYRATSVDIGESSDSWGPGEEGRMRRLLADAGVENVIWDLEVTPYPLGSDAFDAVVMTEVFEHLRDYPITSL